MGEEDLRIDTEEELKYTANAVLRYCENYAPYQRLQTLFISAYNFYENGLKVVTYEDGTQVAANFGSEDVTYCGKTVAPYESLIIE